MNSEMASFLMHLRQFDCSKLDPMKSAFEGIKSELSYTFRIGPKELELEELELEELEFRVASSKFRVFSFELGNGKLSNASTTI